MDTLFSFKSKAPARSVNNNNAMMRLKIQNALYQQELNRVKAANAALALAAEQQKRENEAKVALVAEQQKREHETKVALAAHQREHEARVALAAQQHREQHKPEPRVALAIQKHNHEARVALAPQKHEHEVISAPHNKKAPFGKLLSNMKKLQ
jgi:hypothetical protein